MESVINELVSKGWQHEGVTPTQTVRIPTRRVPLFGKSGGEVATFGGRARLRYGALFVTIGKRTTFFYTRGEHGVMGKATVKTTLQDVIAAEQSVKADVCWSCGKLWSEHSRNRVGHEVCP